MKQPIVTKKQNENLHDHCFRDEKGNFWIKEQECQNCGHSMEPDRQVSFDDSALIAESECPKCGHYVFSVLGTPEFIEYAQGLFLHERTATAVH